MSKFNATKRPRPSGMMFEKRPERLDSKDFDSDEESFDHNRIQKRAKLTSPEESHLTSPRSTDEDKVKGLSSPSVHVRGRKQPRNKQSPKDRVNRPKEGKWTEAGHGTGNGSLMAINRLYETQKRSLDMLQRNTLSNQ